MLHYFLTIASCLRCDEIAPIRSVDFAAACCGNYDPRHVCSHVPPVNRTHAKFLDASAHLQAELNIANRSVGFVGDSLSFEMFVVADCVVDRELSGARFEFYAMHTVPMLRNDTEAQLREILREYDTVVLHFGLWYNWRAADFHNMRLEDYGANYSHLVWEQCSSSAKTHSLPTYSRGASETYAYIRRMDGTRCANLDLPGFISDMKRLRESLEVVIAEATALGRKPLVFLRSTTPQHFGGSPDGTYNLFQQSAAGCSPIVDTEAAFGRNYVLSKIMEPLFRRRIVRYLDTWLFDVDQHRGHINEHDCTHYCQSITYYRLVKLFLAIN